MKLKSTLIAAIFILSIASPSLGWNDVGHKITGYIAWQRMSPKARDAVIRILRSAPEDSHLSVYYQPFGIEPEPKRRLEYFSLVPTWADIVRDRSFPVRYGKYHKSNWHYSDTFWQMLDGNVAVLPPPEQGGLGVEKLIEFDRLMRDSAAPDAEKAIAIAWLLHIGGDLHQPLHTSARVTDTEPKGDQGGNLFLLTPKDTPRENQVNLHWFWDSIVDRNVSLKPNQSEMQYIEAAAKSMMKRHPFAVLQPRLNLGNYAEWQKESFEIVPRDVFSADLKRFEMPSISYRKKAFRIAGGQLALAGYRLGETLNEIFGK